MNKYLVYGRMNCVWCDKAKDLLERYEYRMEYRNIDLDNQFKTELKDFFDNNPDLPKTVPQVFLDGKHIGGYNELAMYIESTSGGYGDGAF